VQGRFKSGASRSVLFGTVRAAVLTFLALAPAACASAGAKEAGAVTAKEMQTIDAEAAAQVEAYFGAPFSEQPKITIAENRAAFNAAFPPEWGMSETECWMVGVGVADFLVVLSPSAWAAEACEHDGSDRAEVKRIVAHELTHTYHGQRNPTRDFTGAESLSWFIEGLATSVAEPEIDGRRARVVAAFNKGTAPAKLEAVWSGDTRYQMAGLLVDYIDQKWGRKKIIELLPAVTQEDALKILGIGEDELLSDFRAWASAGAENK